MKDLLVVFANLLTTLATLLGPGGSRAIVADSLAISTNILDFRVRVLDSLAVRAVGW